MFFLALIACSEDKDARPTADTSTTDSTDLPSETGNTDDSAAPPPLNGRLEDIGICIPTDVSDNVGLGPFTNIETESPFGLGKQSAITLSPITQSDLIEYAPQPGSVDYTIDLGAVTYDLYIPPSYDGSEPYGLVGFVNSGNSGEVKSGWESVLDEHKLIWIGPKDAGNAVNVDIRMGKTIMGMWKLLELYNIDRSRFYVTGNSGGARTAQVLSWLHPRSITGAFPLCGASYFRETTQEFETHEPDAHYEYWGDYFYPNIGGTPFVEWILDYPRPVALLTSTDDFRRGDMLNVFHHGLQADDIPTRYLEVGGNHCATDTTQANDAIGFMDHPMFEVLQDDFSDTEPNIGIGWIDGSAEGASIDRTEGLQLSPSDSAAAVAIAQNQFFWNDRHGLILDASFVPSTANTSFSLWATDLDIELDDIREGQLTSHPGIHIDLNDSELYLYATGLSGGIQPLFRGTYTPNASPMAIQLQLWSGGIQLDIGGKLTAEGNDLISLGPDAELLLMRWSDLPTAWSGQAWADDRPVTLTVLSRGSEPSTVKDIRVRDGRGYVCE